MSMSCAVPTTPDSDQHYFQGVWARLFGQFIQSAREKAGLPIEAAAWMAGMCPEEWASIEAGDLLPNTQEQVRAIAAALDIEWETMTSILLMCRQAWGVQ